jgi:sugar phosphate isomerase/epimerase
MIHSKIDTFPCVFTDLYHLPFEAMLDKLAAMGVKAFELRTGNYPVNHH